MVLAIIKINSEPVFNHEQDKKHNITGQDSTPVESTPYLLQAYIFGNFGQMCNGYLQNL